MIWSCEQTEARLSDYLDGAMAAGERTAFDAHVNACAFCTPLVAGVSHLLTGLHGLEQVQEPPHLVYAILDKTIGPRETAAGWGAFGWVRGLASLRFAYGALSVAATIAILLSATGFSWSKPKLADLQPASIYRNADRQAHLVYARGTKFVNDLRVVHEIQSRLSQDSEIPVNPESTIPESQPDKNPGQTDGTRPAAPRQQNRANGLAKQVELLAIAAVPHTFSRSIICPLQPSLLLFVPGRRMP